MRTGSKDRLSRLSFMDTLIVKIIAIGLISVCWWRL